MSRLEPGQDPRGVRSPMCPFAWVSMLLSSACAAPSERTVDAWLAAYASNDVERMAMHMVEADRGTLRDVIGDLETNATSTLAFSLFARPVSHEIVESTRESPDRNVVTVRVSLENPLPHAAERVGHSLPSVPRIRTITRHMLVILEHESWRVKLDLHAILARARFVLGFTRLVDRGALLDAEAMLSAVPRPPDAGDVQRESDRLVETLTRISTLHGSARCRSTKERSSTVSGR